jgi:hypothetical protein
VHGATPSLLIAIGLPWHLANLCSIGYISTRVALDNCVPDLQALSINHAA